MSSTPLSGNAIRSPNGAPSLSNKTNPPLLDMRCAASQTRSAHTLYLINTVCLHDDTKKHLPLLRYMPDTMRDLIGYWLWKQKKSWCHPGLKWWILKRGKKWIRVLVKYFFTSVLSTLRTASSISLWFSRLRYNHWSVYLCVYCKFSLHSIQMCLFGNMTA